MIQQGTLALVWRSLFQRFLGEYERLYALISKYRGIQERVHHLLEAVKDIPEGADFSEIFSISPFDYGYESWNDKASDSTWFENYTVGAHLPNGSAVQSSIRPVRFPDFFWVNSEAVPDRRGFAEWMGSGFRSDYPSGELAYRGWQAWSDRFVSRVRGVTSILSGVRALIWPE